MNCPARTDASHTASILMTEKKRNGLPSLLTWWAIRLRRGKNVGIVFQFLQRLPSLTLLNNVMLPMELANKYRRSERRERTEHLLDLVGLKAQMHKLPSMVSGGQQQQAAISRGLANEPSSSLTSQLAT